MATSVRLSKAREQWAAAMRGDNLSPGTIKCRMSTLRQLMAVTGDLYVRSLTHRHIDLFFSTYSHWAPGTRNRHRLSLSAFQKWCKRRGYMSADLDLIDGRKRPSIPKRKYTFLSDEQLEEMLEKCKDPRDRILVAMSFYLGLRTSEVTPIRWGDFREDFKRVRIRRRKKGVLVEDDIPVRANLRKEIHRWQVVICRHMGTVRPKEDWYVITPKLTKPDRDTMGRYVQQSTGYDPLRRLVNNAYDVVKKALASIGVTARGEGTHTLRRSSLSLIRDKVNAKGGNGIRAAQLQAGHAAQSTTEGYLDEDKDRDERDMWIEGLDDDPDDGVPAGTDAEILVFPERGGDVGT